MTGRYFEGDHPDLENRLESHFERVRCSFESLGITGAMVLGGGYGRGEGGVMASADGVEFSNDLDYFLFTDQPDAVALSSWCREIERSETLSLGIDVEIKCLRQESLGDPSRSMMFADLVAGHVVVAGDGSFLEKMKEGLEFSRIAPEEATRLLWNRGSGMFFARCRMGIDGEMKFVIRNHAKLKLALGDGWLCLNGQYTSKCRERGRRIQGAELPENLAWVKVWHAEGVDFKFHPFATGPTWAELEAESRRLIDAWGIVYLAAEEKRLGRSLGGFLEYQSIGRLLTENSSLKNLALSLRDRIKRGGCVRPVRDYPRAGLMRALPCLLGLTPAGVSEAGNFLPRPGGNLSEITSWDSVYSKWWAYYA